jgi:hypothetical protein
VTCEHCRQPFARRTRTRDANRFCSKKCGGANRTTAKAAKRAAERAANAPTCRVCTHRFDASPRRRFCSDACRKEQARRDDRALHATRKAVVSRACRCCGTVFAPAYGCKRRGFCSNACARKVAKRIGKRKRRAAQRGVYAESVDPITVFVRDGWRCQLCGVPTPKAQRGTTRPTAPELDHIVPLAAGGPHTYTNTQCACRRCNSVKGCNVLGQLRLAV